ncbi:MAG: hypothetical protein ACTSRZ_03030 [Promethearchaeota archaeon]
MKEQLEDLLKNGKNWEKMITDIPGIFVVKVPGPKSDPSKARLMIEVNPVDSNGKPKKFKGLFIPDSESYLEYVEALNDDRVPKILSVIEEINPKPTTTKMRKLKIE